MTVTFTMTVISSCIVLALCAMMPHRSLSGMVSNLEPTLSYYIVLCLILVAHRDYVIS